MNLYFRKHLIFIAIKALSHYIDIFFGFSQIRCLVTGFVNLSVFLNYLKVFSYVALTIALTIVIVASITIHST